MIFKCKTFDFLGDKFDSVELDIGVSSMSSRWKNETHFNEAIDVIDVSNGLCEARNEYGGHWRFVISGTKITGIVSFYHEEKEKFVVTTFDGVMTAPS